MIQFHTSFTLITKPYHLLYLLDSLLSKDKEVSRTWGDIGYQFTAIQNLCNESEGSIKTRTWLGLLPWHLQFKITVLSRDCCLFASITSINYWPSSIPFICCKANVYMGSPLSPSLTVHLLHQLLNKLRIDCSSLPPSPYPSRPYRYTPSH